MDQNQKKKIITNMNELFTALSQAQSEFPVITPNRKNNRGYHCDLFQMRRHIDPILNKHGLALMQHVDSSTNAAGDIITVISNVLIHSSGQMYISKAPLVYDAENKIMSHNQATGCSITYMTRYCYKNILGLCIPDDPDDNDGYVTPLNKPHEYVPEVEQGGCVSKDQYGMLMELLKDRDDLIGRICKGFAINTIAELPRKEFHTTYNRIQSIIKEEKLT
jgi:hypothetical protein